MPDQPPVSHITDDAAPGPHHPAGSPEGHFRPDPQMGQQQSDHTAVTDDMVERAAAVLYGSDDVANRPGYLRKARRVLSAGLAGYTPVPNAPEPDMQREQLDGTMRIWNVGGWSVTAKNDSVAIKFGPDGLGDGVAFRPDKVRAVVAAMLAGADLLLAAGSREDSDG